MIKYLILALVFVSQGFAVSGQFVQGAGVALQGGLAASIASKKGWSCCTPATAACCAMAVSAGLSALQMFDKSGEAASMSDNYSCESLADSTFCNWTPQGYTGDEVAYDNNGNIVDSSIATTASGGSGAPGAGNSGAVFTGYSPQQMQAMRAEGLAKTQETFKALAAKGVYATTDKKGVQLANGKVIPFSSISSPSAMKSSGFSDSDIAMVEKMKKEAKNLMKQDMRQYGFGYSGGGGKAFRKNTVARKKNGGADYNKLLNQFMNKPGDKNQARGVASAAGLTKNLSNGEKIGVAQDNIFEMVHRRYQKITSKREFIP